ncbi:hypothetical protein BFP70_15090 [Thioclava sp. SK-1]|uniref:DUF3429 domain-containing protein n=1 Tax=Thioclava sp. SK-1 TaxID=1889770 RepID=UPI000824C9CC|nr:DUF3429 domain-containing protein [Thioclava sp. SK-1]OCX61632.1 hypothetical protein BFP70_15090 [Thioclava sp. SK-1]
MIRSGGAKIPTVALGLGLTGLLPFLWGVVVTQTGALALPAVVQPHIAVQAYGLMIFCFMAGTLWGFAAKAGWSVGYVLSILPVLFFMALAALGLPIGFVLMAGFVILLPLDGLFQKRAAAPQWWLKLRIGLSLVVLACLYTL